MQPWIWSMSHSLYKHSDAYVTFHKFMTFHNHRSGLCQHAHMKRSPYRTHVPIDAVWIHSFISRSFKKTTQRRSRLQHGQKSSLKVRKYHWRESPRKEAKLQREAIPGRGTHHKESAFLHSRGSGKGDKSESLSRW